MQKVRIVTDNVAQLTKDIIDQHLITVVPAAIIFCDGRMFIDGVDITPADAYRLLAQNPKEFITSAIPPSYFAESFQHLGQSAGQIFCITISSKFSAIHTNALLAAEQMKIMNPKLDIRVFDSMNAAGGEGLIVLSAAKAATEGHDVTTVAAVAEKARQNTECLFVFDTLSYTYRTGRIPKVASQAADVLSVKPICRIAKDGKVHFVSLARSRHKGVEQLIEITRERMGERLTNIIIMHTAAQAEAEKLEDRVKKEFNCQTIFTSEFSPVMGYGTGPGVLGIAACPAF